MTLQLGTLRQLSLRKSPRNQAEAQPMYVLMNRRLPRGLRQQSGSLTLTASGGISGHGGLSRKSNPESRSFIISGICWYPEPGMGRQIWRFDLQLHELLAIAHCLLHSIAHQRQSQPSLSPVTIISLVLPLSAVHIPCYLSSFPNSRSHICSLQCCPALGCLFRGPTLRIQFIVLFLHPIIQGKYCWTISIFSQLYFK